MAKIKVKKPKIIVRRQETLFYFPYKGEAVRELKKLPVGARAWDKLNGCWKCATTHEVLQHILNICEKFYEDDFDLALVDITAEEVLSGEKLIDRTNYYTVLGIETDATTSQIKKTYFALAKKHHPDAGGNKEDFTAIHTAYSVLSDARRRGKYDAALRIFQGITTEKSGPSFTVDSFKT